MLSRTLKNIYSWPITWDHHIQQVHHEIQMNAAAGSFPETRKYQL